MSEALLPKDSVNNFELVEATETGGYTSVKFERNLTTGEADLDVQFTVKLYINKYSYKVCGRAAKFYSPKNACVKASVKSQVILLCISLKSESSNDSRKFQVT